MEAQRNAWPSVRSTSKLKASQGKRTAPLPPGSQDDRPHYQRAPPPPTAVTVPCQPVVVPKTTPPVQADSVRRQEKNRRKSHSASKRACRNVPKDKLAPGGW